MKYNTWIWIIVLLIVISAAWYIGRRSTLSIPLKTAPSVAPATTSPEHAVPGTAAHQTSSGHAPAQEAAAQTAGFAPLQSLLAEHLTVICSVTQSTKGFTRSGTVYVSNGTMRGDFFSTTQGSSAVISMIDDGVSLYAWNAATGAGIKLSATKSVDNAAMAQWGGIDPTVSVRYVCHPWVANDSFFVLPSTITFS